MPYNNTPIEPPTEFTGSVSLPLARVKKIINADPDTTSCSNNAAFAITVATEMFVQYLVEQTHHVVKTERKPRRNIQYKDVANAVARFDNLEFLSDVVPRTQSYKEFKEKQAKKVAEKEARDAANKAAEGKLEDAERQQTGPHQQQLPYGYQTNGQAMPPPMTSPAIGANGHARSHSSHSRSHSLEHQGIINPEPPADAMQIDQSPQSQRTYDAYSSSPEMNRDPASQQLQMEAKAVNGERPGTSSGRGFVMPNGDVV